MPPWIIFFLILASFFVFIKIYEYQQKLLNLAHQNLDRQENTNTLNRDISAVAPIVNQNPDLSQPPKAANDPVPQPQEEPQEEQNSSALTVVQNSSNLISLNGSFGTSLRPSARTHYSGRNLRDIHDLGSQGSHFSSLIREHSKLFWERYFFIYGLVPADNQRNQTSCGIVADNSVVQVSTRTIRESIDISTFCVLPHYQFVSDNRNDVKSFELRLSEKNFYSISINLQHVYSYQRPDQSTHCLIGNYTLDFEAMLTSCGLNILEKKSDVLKNALWDYFQQPSIIDQLTKSVFRFEDCNFYPQTACPFTINLPSKRLTLKQESITPTRRPVTGVTYPKAETVQLITFRPQSQITVKEWSFSRCVML